MEGDSRAWEELVQLYSGRVYNVAYRFTHQFDAAQDLTQDVFLKVYQNLSGYRSDLGALGNWIMRVARNLIIDQHRSTKGKRNVAGSEELEVLDFKPDSHLSGSLPGPHESLHYKERAQFLARGLQRLSDVLREAVILRDIEGYNYSEISQILSVPEGTVKSRINRGRIELAKILKKNQSEPTGADL
ncbi:MAG: RNA polymerase sigma factor [Acidobacteriota bacterium]